MHTYTRLGNRVCFQTLFQNQRLSAGHHEATNPTHFRAKRLYFVGFSRMLELVALRKKISRPTEKIFVKECLASGITSPSSMRDAYKTRYGKEYSTDAFEKALKRQGVTKEQRKAISQEAIKQTEVKDISQYDEWKRYFGFAKFQQVGEEHKQRTAKYLRELWEAMGGGDPREWKLLEGDNSLIKKMGELVGQDEKGRWKQPHRVLSLLGAYNRVFQGYLPKGWSTGLKREAGELKDFLEFETFSEFIEKLSDTNAMSREGWQACYEEQTSAAAREGEELDTGILSLKWEDIDFKTRRCSIREKGERGKPSRLWTQVPLDMFPWRKAWQTLMKWWEQQGKPTSGRCFPVSYKQYSEQFHNTRHKCLSEFSRDDETHVPHIFRKTHVQWAKRMGVSLDNICGDTVSKPNIGRYGVGWTDPKICLQYYMTKESWEYEEQDELIAKRLEKMLSSPHGKKATLELVAFNPCFEESQKLLCGIVE